jgi:hypothetical protein
MKLYVSGPMTGIKDFNYPAFTLACRVLRECGHDVVSPHEVAHLDNGVAGSLSWKDYLKGDLAVLLPCAGIVLLPGWSASRGAKLELATALALEMHVYYLEDDGILRDIQ